MKQEYRLLCQNEKSIPLFLQAWWLDLLCGENWDVVLVSKKGEIQAALPYRVSYKAGLKYLGQAPFSQYLGPWLRPSNAKYLKLKQREKKLLTALLEALPKFDVYSQNWSPQNQNWLPFYWKGFEQTTRYTYRLEVQSPEQIWQGMQSNIKSDIRKAEQRFQVQIKEHQDIQLFLDLIIKTFQRQHLSLPFNEDKLRQLFEECQKRKVSQLLVAEDPQGNFHAGTFCVWDQYQSYYLLGGGDPEFRNSGATSLCLWQAIQNAMHNKLIFDFEGSMIESVERFFRAFGAEQTPYYQLKKVNSRKLKLYYALKNLLGK